MSEVDPKLMTIFTVALERIDPSARGEYLDRACEGDADLRQRVEPRSWPRMHGPAGAWKSNSTEMPESTARDTEEPTQPSIVQGGPTTEPATGQQRPLGGATTITSSPPADRSGRFVAGQVIAGRYTLLEVLGEGGMGTVYRADQTEPVKCQVALKLIRVGMDSARCRPASTPSDRRWP